VAEAEEQEVQHQLLLFLMLELEDLLQILTLHGWLQFLLL
jgi:hypothetical protein